MKLTFFFLLRRLFFTIFYQRRLLNQDPMFCGVIKKTWDSAGVKCNHLQFLLCNSTFCPIYSHRQKRMKQMKQKRKQGKVDVNEDDPFELFILSTSIRYCYYAETHKILGNTFGMCILQVCFNAIQLV